MHTNTTSGGIGFYTASPRSALASLAIACLAASAVTATADAVTWSDGDLLVTAQPLIVTSSAPPTGGDRVVTPGDTSTSAGIDMTGVGRLFLDTDPTAGFGSLCSGSLLSDGQTLLTCAHCVTDDFGAPTVIDGADGNTVTFATASGNLSRTFTSADVTVHPDYTGDVLDGFDLAVIDLGTPLPSDVTRYDLNTQASIEGLTHVAAGYGRSGDGSTGNLLGSGTLRSGLNDYESFGLAINGINNPETQLTADFDSGSAANDAFDFFFGAPDLGQGVDEVGIASGDSGGPSFIVDGGAPLIAGVHSYGLRLEYNNGTSSDLDGIVNSTFGEFYVDARIAEASMLSFVEANMVLYDLGDVDLDGDIDADDIDLLYASLGSTDSLFDLDQDGGAADQQDVDELVRGILVTEYGDIDLDGNVNAVDFSILSGNFNSLIGGWAMGDMDGSGDVDAVDFSLLSGNFNFMSAGAAAIPEPASLVPAVMAILGCGRRRQR